MTGIAAAIILGSILLLILVVRSQRETMAEEVCDFMALLCLGFGLLILAQIPQGPIQTVASLAFFGAAVWFVILHWRIARRRGMAVADG